MYLIVEKMKRRGLPCDQILFDVFQARINDDEFASCFATSLTRAITGKDTFMGLMNSFLVSMRMSNPSEIQLFSDALHCIGRVTQKEDTFVDHEDEYLFNLS
jgi:hypothetical protein